MVPTRHIALNTESQPVIIQLQYDVLQQLMHFCCLEELDTKSKVLETYIATSLTNRLV